MENQSSHTIADENPTDKAKKENENNEEESDRENECAICLDKWTSTGDHMATKLKCGHIFGYSCIRQWVDVSLFCPICKSSNPNRQLRRVYQRVRTTSTSLIIEGSSHGGRLTRARRRQALSRRPTEARPAADDTLNAEATGSQDSQEADLGTGSLCNNENGLRNINDIPTTSGVNEASGHEGQSASSHGGQTASSHGGQTASSHGGQTASGRVRSRSPRDARLAADEILRENADIHRAKISIQSTNSTKRTTPPQAETDIGISKVHRVTG